MLNATGDRDSPDTGDIMKYWIPALAGLSLGACTSVNVHPVDRGVALSHVCIRTNPAVKVEDFTMVMQDGFQRHGIAAEFITVICQLHATTLSTTPRCARGISNPTSRKRRSA